MKAKTAFDKNCSFWHSRLAPEVTICPQHLAFSSTDALMSECSKQQQPSLLTIHHCSTAIYPNSNMVSKILAKHKQERKCPQTIAVEAAGEQINNFSKQDYGAVYVKARMRGP